MYHKYNNSNSCVSRQGVECSVNDQTNAERRVCVILILCKGLDEIFPKPPFSLCAVC